jgi:hypothetical protein
MGAVPGENIIARTVDLALLVAHIVKAEDA